jgi:hypothetical protein
MRLIHANRTESGHPEGIRAELLEPGRCPSEKELPVKKPLLLLLPSVLVLFLGIGAVMAGAGNKAKPYDSQADSQAGLCLGIVDIGCSRSDSRTQNSGAASHASSMPLAILGQEIPPENEAACEAVGVPQSGVVKTDQSAGITLGPIDLLTAACSAQAVQENNAASDAQSSVLEADLGAASASVASSSAENKTTSGLANSSASFTAAEADAGGLHVEAVSCTSSSKATKQNASTETSGSLLVVGEDSVPDLGLCALFVQSSASHTSG